MLAAMMMAVLAQPVPGTWTGYVNGWVPSTPPPRAPLLLSPVRRPFVRPTVMFLPMPLVLQTAPAPSERLEERVISQQAALLAQQQAAQAQLLAQQAQLAAEQQRLQAEAQRQQAELRQRELDAEAARRADELARQLRSEQEARERAIAEREAARLADARAHQADKSPEIHRWTDGEGVVHYSTRPHR